MARQYQVDGEPVFVDRALGQELSMLKGFMKAESGIQAVYAAMDKIKEQREYIDRLTQRIAELESENEQLYKSIRLINTAVSYYPIQYTVEIMSKEVRKITEAVIKREPNE